MKAQHEDSSKVTGNSRLGSILYAALLTGVSMAGWDVAKALLWDQRFCGASLHLLLGTSLIITGAAVLYLFVYGIVAVFRKRHGLLTASFRYGLGWGGFVFFAIFLVLPRYLIQLSLSHYVHPLWYPGLVLILVICVFFAGFCGKIAARLASKATGSVSLLVAAHTIHWVLPLFVLYCGVVAGSSLYANATEAVFFIICAISLVLVLVGCYLIYWWIQKGWGIRCMLAVVLMMLLLPWIQWAIPETRSSSFDKAPVSTLKAPRVLLIVIDTLRPDALSCYGSSNPTPNIDALASEGMLFTDVVAASPWTLPSVTTIHTGHSPLVHQILSPGDRYPEEGVAMAELFQQHGYHTGAVGFNPFLNEESGLFQGFDTYRMHPPSIFAAPTLGGSLLKAMMVHGAGQTWNGDMALLTDELLSWLEPIREEAFFAWFHPYTPHLPYSPPKRFIPESTSWGDSVGLIDFLAMKQESLELTAEDQEAFRELYDAEVRYVDEQIGRLCDVLKGWGIYEDSLIVFTSDHGEEFWDHDGFEHGHTFYQELLHVPLIIKLPGQQQGEVISTKATLEDILPTLSQFCELASPSEPFTGEPLLDAQGIPRVPQSRIRYATGTLYGEAGEALFWEKHKYIRYFESKGEALYNLEEDPGERQSLLEAHPEWRTRALELLEQYHRRCETGELSTETDAEAAPVIDKGSRELMQSLGYL